MKQLLALAFLFFPSNIFACLNYYVINESGQSSMYEGWKPHSIYTDPAGTLKELVFYEKKLARAPDKERYRYVSNYAVCLIKLGRNKEALPLLKKLVAEKPGEYELLSNLATCYELTGELDSALFYMEKSVLVNPASHNFSEWFHVDFLRAAILVKKNPSGLTNLNILHIDTARSQEIGHQLTEQLQERIPLTSAPDNLLSKAIEESADYFKRVISIDWAIWLYAIAAGYAADEPAKKHLWEKIEKARARMMELPHKAAKESDNAERRALLGKNWKAFIQKDINKWSSYKAPYNGKITALRL